MIKNYSLFLIAFLCFISMGFGQSDIIISQYIETNSGTTPKGIEIFNISGGDIDFSISNLQVYQGTNGAACSNISAITLTSGVLLANEVWVFGTPDLIAYSTTNGTGLSGTTTYAFSFNGDDALQVYLGGVLQDEFGTCGSDPGAAWTGNGVSTVNQNIAVQDGFCDGDLDGWTDPSTRFTTISNDPYSGGGTAGMIGFGDAPTPCITCTDTLDYYAIEPPAFKSITVGGIFDVEAQAYEFGVTETAGQGAGVKCWIGYSTFNTDPSTWPETSWTLAPFQSQQGSNDQFSLEIGSGLSPGTYFYASRFSLNDCIYTYAYYGPNNGVLTVVNPDQVDWCNLQFPEVGNITQSGIFDVYARVYEPGVTDAVGRGGGIECWIGYSAVDASVGNSINNTTTRADFDSSNWTWIPADYNQDYGDDDEYYVNIGSCIPPGTYYYASRFRLNNTGSFTYGGITPPNGGSFWDGTNFVSGVITVDPPSTIADVVITEIMYNSSGTDDEWIEICNVSGSTQDLSHYEIDIDDNGSVEYTFPCNTTLPAGNCLIVSLGSDGDGTFNNDCEINPVDYGITADTLDTNNLTNTGGTTIALYASDGTSEVDTVTYNVSDGGSPPYSLHVIDAAQDNSDTSSNWQEVNHGGSPGANSIIPSCIPTDSDINVEGNLVPYPDIFPGDGTNIPAGFNNTLYAARPIGTSEAKTFRISNEGLSDLEISNISIGGTNPGDFTITGTAPASTIAYGDIEILEITFSPLATGTRTATVVIESNDIDEDPFIFNIEGTGQCAAATYELSPSEGPAGTIVTVTTISGANPDSSTALYGVTSTTVTNISATTFEITIPDNAISSNITFDDLTGCTRNLSFVVIDNDISSCEGVGTPPADIFISEVTDQDSSVGGHSYVELYNGTGADVDISDYFIEVHSNGNSTPNGYINIPNGTILANDDTYVISFGTAATEVDPASQNDYFSSGTIGINDRDYLILNDGTSDIDLWGDTSGNAFTGGIGTDFTTGLPNGSDYTYRRLIIGPSLAWDPSEWTLITPVNYSDIGNYTFSLGVPPNVITSPNVPISNCDLSVTLEVEGQEGFNGLGNTQFLAYQWYYNAPGDSSWSTIDGTTHGGVYSGFNSDSLIISSTLNLDGYQYYCQIREDNDTCYQASNAVRLTVDAVTWDGSSWSNVTGPDINTIAIINGNYNTSIGVNNQTSFSACNLIVNSGTLTIANGNFVEVANDVSVNGGAIQVDTQGAFIQQGIGSAAGSFTLNGGTSQVSKFTAPLANWYDYTYWSSPVANELVSNALDSANPNRRFWFNANNYLDLDNDNIDDNANDWTLVGGISDPYNSMTPGRGYAATHNTIGFIPNASYQYIFAGALNTGDISYPLYYNNANTDHWNLIGNPYPCALDINELFSVNSGVIKQVAYVWSHYRAPLSTNPGNEVLNFNQSDYLTFNASGPLGNGSDLDGDGDIDGDDIPSNYIGSGQAFFVSSLANSNIVFNNNMRISGENTNLQFFRQQVVNNSPEKFWLNLNSDNGAYSQLLMAYLDDATDSNDGSVYDAKRLITDNASSIYSLIESEPESKFSIQAKNTNSLSLEEVIPVGFNTNIQSSTIYTLKLLKLSGDFMSSNDIYLHDIYLQQYHNLNESDYNFTSEPGEFNDRFEIVFQTTTLSTDETLLSANDLTIIELPDGSVKFKVDKNHTIAQVEIIDLLGRTLYTLKGTSSEAIYFLPQLSQSAYIAKVTLDNGQTLSKKAIKKH